MKLNADCIRDVLLYLEENLVVDIIQMQFQILTMEQVQKSLSDNYSEEEVWYSIYNLHKIRFIEGKINNAGKHIMYFCEIENISWEGHHFLNNVRPDTIWEATKKKAKSLGGISIQGLAMLSSSIVQGVASQPDLIKAIVDQII